MDTVVQDGAECSSACFVVFSAGVRKFASYGAAIGVHGASNDKGEESEGSMAATVEMAKSIKNMGVPPGIIGKMVVTPPDQMVWLKFDDLREMGVDMAETKKRAATASQPPGSGGRERLLPLPRGLRGRGRYRVG
jgi:hypothetical protein